MKEKVITWVSLAVVIVGVIVLVITAVQDCRAKSGMFTTTEQMREYVRTK